MHVCNGRIAAPPPFLVSGRVSEVKTVGVFSSISILLIPLNKATANIATDMAGDNQRLQDTSSLFINNQTSIGVSTFTFMRDFSLVEIWFGGGGGGGGGGLGVPNYYQYQGRWSQTMLDQEGGEQGG